MIFSALQSDSTSQRLLSLSGRVWMIPRTPRVPAPVPPTPPPPPAWRPRSGPARRRRRRGLRRCWWRYRKIVIEFDYVFIVNKLSEELGLTFTGLV